jgi:hypothetical protein
MRPEFHKFNRDQDVAEKFQNGINESEKLGNLTKVDKIIV